MNRRQFSIGMTGLGLGLLLNGCQTAPGARNSDGGRPSDSPLLFIAGAWHGGWCWKFVAEEILKKQPFRRLYSPSLLGLADKSDALSSTLGLQDQIDDIAALIEREKLQDFTLVGHSFGGMIITALAHRFSDRIRHLVYLDAVIPEDGQSFITAGQKLSQHLVAQREAAFRSLATDGVALPPLPPSAFGIPKDHPGYDWVQDHLTPHPLKTCLDPISLADQTTERIPKSYIRCTDPLLQQPAIVAGSMRAKSEFGWRFLELSTGHDAMITAPQALAEILIDM